MQHSVLPLKKLISTIQGIAEKLKSGKDQIDVILLYFAKSFDKVQHKRLLHKLCHYGVRGKSYEATSGGSLMYTRNNSGPNTVPCGTAESTSSFADSHPSTSTCCVLEDKKDVIYCRIFHGLHSDKV
jgi:hypothetical protein